jgi:hypothetical protein
MTQCMVRPCVARGFHRSVGFAVLQMAKMSGASSSVLATPARNAAIGVVSDDLSADVISSRVMDVECSWCAELERGCTWCMSTLYSLQALL